MPAVKRILCCVGLRGDCERVLARSVWLAGATGAELHAALEAHFASLDGSFVDVAPLADVDRTPELDPETFNGTNRMRLHVFADDSRAQAVLMAVYDNLGKGASGAAVQNLNLMLGVDAAESLAA